MTERLRSGFTTGSCAAAAAKAATVGCLTGQTPATVEIRLPKGQLVTFSVQVDDAGRAVVIKDAGDDPDCTNGAHVTASVRLIDEAEVSIKGGPGVGTVTKDGLGLPVGTAAINPVPRRMITEAVRSVTDHGVEVIISVPGGEEMARATTNDRLGILGGISILGTTGIVKPFSTAAYRASIVQQIDVAAANGQTHIVLVTGSRTETAAIELFPQLDPVAIVEVGDYTGVAVKRAASHQPELITWVGMAGKVAKLAQGLLMTHFHRANVDTKLLATVAQATGASERVIAAATETVTARHFYECCQREGDLRPLLALTELAATNCFEAAGSRIPIEVMMVDFDSLEVVATHRLVP
ncbi:cobalt-precorrin-5B (C(1))-methyltransferase [Ferrimicrobium sp.]|uniref:cobalt-precorrin-5B (C(1))-methyltransferase n=1 Tax=Ferrimicrobium sp. TaxID=2926050 RepID=UPI0026193648|nr:cobalt-precorrin-5B (C(1))-methyltransferase [Ferrimicrobium sp.]